MSTRFTAHCCEPDKCWMRSCMWPGERKGTYAQGRGYTSYYKVPIPECMTRDRQGCPHPLPEPDPEHARCCYAPVYKGRGKLRTCQTCGAKAPPKPAALLNKLPRQQGVPCRHESQKGCMVSGWRECPDCQGYWAGRDGVEPFEVPTHTFNDMLNELDRRLSRTPPSPHLR